MPTPYVPNPTDATQPDESVPAYTAALEFQALKGRVNALAAASVQSVTGNIVSGTVQNPVVTQVNSDWNAVSGLAQILNKPQIPAGTSINNLVGAVSLNAGQNISITTNGQTITITGTATAQVNSDWNATTGVAQILNKPTIVTSFNGTAGAVSLVAGTNITFSKDGNTFTINASGGGSGNVQSVTGNIVSGTAANPVVTQVQADWNAVSGLAQIANKPTIPAAQVNSDWNATTGVAQIFNKPTIPAAQVNADWNATTGVAVVLNKPTIPVGTSVNGLTGAVTLAAGSNTTITVNGQTITIASTASGGVNNVANFAIPFIGTYTTSDGSSGNGVSVVDAGALLLNLSFVTATAIQNGASVATVTLTATIAAMPTDFVVGNAIFLRETNDLFYATEATVTAVTYVGTLYTLTCSVGSFISKTGNAIPAGTYVLDAHSVRFTTPSVINGVELNSRFAGEIKFTSSDNSLVPRVTSDNRNALTIDLPAGDNLVESKLSPYTSLTRVDIGTSSGKDVGIGAYGTKCIDLTDVATESTTNTSGVPFQSDDNQYGGMASYYTGTYQAIVVAVNGTLYINAAQGSTAFTASPLSLSGVQLVAVNAWADGITAFNNTALLQYVNGAGNNLVFKLTIGATSYTFNDVVTAPTGRFFAQMESISVTVNGSDYWIAFAATDPGNVHVCLVRARAVTSGSTFTLSDITINDLNSTTISAEAIAFGNSFTSVIILDSGGNIWIRNSSSVTRLIAGAVPEAGPDDYNFMQFDPRARILTVTGSDNTIVRVSIPGDGTAIVQAGYGAPTNAINVYGVVVQYPTTVSIPVVYTINPFQVGVGTSVRLVTYSLQLITSITVPLKISAGIRDSANTLIPAGQTLRVAAGGTSLEGYTPAARFQQFRLPTTQTSNTSTAILFTVAAVSSGTAFCSVNSSGTFTFSEVGLYQVTVEANASGNPDAWGYWSGDSNTRRFGQLSGSIVKGAVTFYLNITVANQTFFYKDNNGNTWFGASDTGSYISFLKLT